ncbi:MAG: phospho-N-acetylmuramoyl-pentapeptide-transferase [Bacillota bacterium]
MDFFLVFLLTFFVTAFLMPLFIQYFKKYQLGQQIREEGPETHYNKAGIPTMGGIIIMLVVILAIFITIPFGFKRNVLLLIIITNGFLGFLDDYLNIKVEDSLGLKAKTKFGGQVLIGSIVGLFLYSSNMTYLYIPFIELSINMGLFILPFALFIIPGVSNAVNLSDGLDGLAAGLTTISTLLYIPILYFIGNNELALISLITAASCLAFLWFNINPARVFMGDTGSLFLGSLLAGIALLSGTSLFLILLGGMFLVITVSVIIQVSYFKLSGGKRIFKMAPLHHHFELSGWPEVKVTGRFVIIQLILALLAVGAALPYWSNL